VDNKDQFKEYRRTEDRARPVGFAKHALRLVHPLIEPVMQRSIGLYAEAVNRAQGGAEPAHDYPSRVARFVNQVLGSALDGAMVHAQAFGHDLIDDTTDGIERWIKRWEG
jgi:hypothetical protein